MNQDDPMDSARGIVLQAKSRHTKHRLSSCLIPCLSLLFLAVVLSFYSESTEHLDRINITEGPISQFLPIYSGEIHYSRIPNEYWRHRIQMVKAMGFNSISVYVMWNYHEIEKEIFDFETRDKNISKFLAIAKEENMHVLLRPGPYVCAEWDFGGLPARLLGIKDLEIRTHSALYQAEVRVYFKNLAEQIRPFLFKNKGPIILVQIENELGSLNSDIAHTESLVNMWAEFGIESQFYIEDAAKNWEKHYWPGLHVGLSEGSTVREFAEIDISPERTNDSLIFGGEIYTGWLTHWGEKTNGRPLDQFETHLKKLVKAGRSVSLYVAHGGTNFKLTAGANGFPDNDYTPVITSYDYDAPINEQGSPTPKYHSIRNIMKKHTKKILPTVPEPIKTISIPPIRIDKIDAYLFSNLPKPKLVDSELTYLESNKLKMYQQGFVLYETILTEKKDYLFNVTFGDFMMVYVDGKFQGSLAREKKAYQQLKVSCSVGQCKLRLLVEAMGHINYGAKQSTDRKGLLEFTELDSESKTEFRWNITALPITPSLFFWKSTVVSATFPVVKSSTFQLEETGDTFFDVSSFGKGYLWVNGNLLGRYWSKGPQQRLYCPGVWLKNGKNSIRVLQLLDDGNSALSGHQTSLSKSN